MITIDKYRVAAKNITIWLLELSFMNVVFLVTFLESSGLKDLALKNEINHHVKNGHTDFFYKDYTVATTVTGIIMPSFKLIG